MANHGSNLKLFDSIKTENQYLQRPGQCILSCNLSFKLCTVCLEQGRISSLYVPQGNQSDLLLDNIVERQQLSNRNFRTYFCLDKWYEKYDMLF